MIILLVILAIIAIAGFAVTTALRKGLDPKDECDKDRLKILGIIRGAVIGVCVAIFDWQRQNHGSNRGWYREDLRQGRPYCLRRPQFRESDL